MGAIIFTLDIHEGANGLQPLMEYVSNKEKTDLVQNGFEALFDYAQNEEKTTLSLPQENEKVLLVSGVKCDPNTASEEFVVLKNRYRESNPEYFSPFDFTDKRSGKTKSVTKSPVVAIHIVQSFEETDIDPRLVNEIGVAFAESLGVQAVVSTHCNQDLTSKYGAEHIHNHIVVNAYMPNGMEKFYMNQTKRIELRRLSDKLCREYGIEVTLQEPSIQQQLSLRGYNYAEHKNIKEGKSWKETVRNDIRCCFDASDTKNEFLEMMKEYGYEIHAEKDGSVCWQHEGKTKGKYIWDSKLGQEYSIGNLFDEKGKLIRFVERPSVQKSKETDCHKIISISRYDITGRRRSDLELMIRRAINIIQRVAILIKKVTKQNNKAYNANAKLALMQEALQSLQNYGIENSEDLNNKIDIAGKNLNIAKGAVSRLEGEMKYYSTVEKLIANYRNAEHLYKSVYHWEAPHDLHINKYSDIDIGNAKASICPLSTREKSELFQLMDKHPNLRIENAGKSYSNVSAIQFRAIRDYFRGKSPQPEYLVSVDMINHKMAYERQYKYLSERLAFVPKQAERQKVAELLAKNNHNMDVSKLSVADIINIENCYGTMPLSDTLISMEKQKLLQEKLTECNRTTARPVNSITESEYVEIINYMAGRSRTAPSLLKQRIEPSETDLTKTKRLAMQMAISPKVPWEDMTKEDIQNLYGWLISQGQEPFCVQCSNSASWEHNKEIFHHEISVETLQKQEILISLRNSINELAQLGILIEDIPELEQKISSIKNELASTSAVREEFTGEYKQLLRLKQQTMYAQDKIFLYGSLFDSKEMRELEKGTVISEQKDNEPSENEENEAQNAKEKTSPENILSNITRKRGILDKDFDI